METKLIHEFEIQLGITLPVILKDFLGAPWNLEEFRAFTIEEFTSLEWLFYEFPLRTLPFLIEPDGSMVGIYFPRESPSPFIVAYTNDVPGLEPLSGDVAAFFADIDSYSLQRRREEPSPSTEPLSWGTLLFSSASLTPELEVLKPIALNLTDAGDIDLRVIDSLLKRIRHKSKKVSDRTEVQSILAQKLTNSLQVLDRQWWLGLAEELAQQGHYGEAIAALENCQIIHRIHPYYGHAPSKSILANFPEFAEVFARLLPLAVEHGDKLDENLARHQLNQVVQ